MAPLAPSNTPRFRIHYTANGHDHSLQVRSGSSPAAVGIMFDAYFQRFGVAATDITINFVDWAPTGSDIFNPVTTGLESNVYTGGADVAECEPWAYTFVGRTSGGRRVRIAQFGALFLGQNYRFSPGESTPLDLALNELVVMGGNLLGIDGLTPVWKSYVNVQVNDHWVKVVR